MGPDPNSPTIGNERSGTKYLIFRVLIVFVGFGLAVLYKTFFELAYLEGMARFVYGLLAVYLVFAVVSLAVYYRGRELRGWQVVVDFIFQSALVWATGGVLSVFTPLIFVTLVAATRHISTRGALILATVATMALTGTMVAYALGIGPVFVGANYWSFVHDRRTLVIAYLIANVLGLYTTSALGSVLSRGLRRIEGIHREILENMAEGLVAVDTEGRVVNLNRELRKLLGVAPNLLEGRVPHLDEVLPGEEFRGLREAFFRGERRRFETTFRDASGRDCEVEVKISTVKDHGGAARFRIGLVADMTLKREVEAAENRIQKLEDLHVMAMGIAHELRNPMASIRGCVQELVRPHSETTNKKRLAEIICKESDRLDRTIEEFLHYARSAPLDLKSVDLQEVIDEALVLLKARPEFGGRSVVRQSSDGDYRISGDRDRLTQLFLNLGLNALDATQPDTGEIRISIRPREDPLPDRRWSERGVDSRGVEVLFSDNGCGMDRKTAQRVFTPFFTTKTSGSGLGLCIVEKILRDHRGVLELNSGAQGTTIGMWFPVGCESEPVTTTSNAYSIETESLLP